jgi:hypothetical protein
VGVIAAIAVGGGVAAVLSLQQDDGGGGGTAGSSESGVVVDGAPVTGTGDDISTGTGDDEAAAPAPELGPAIAVPMDAYWTPTGAWCEAGDVLDIRVTGEAHHDASPTSLVGPDGLTGGEHPEARVEGFENVNTASVIGSFPDHNNLRFGVGTGTSYTCEYAGQLYLGINDRNLDGNHGAFDAWVTRTRPDE